MKETLSPEGRDVCLHARRGSGISGSQICSMLSGASSAASLRELVWTLSWSSSFWMDGYQEASQDIDLICDPVMKDVVGKIWPRSVLIFIIRSGKVATILKPFDQVQYNRFEVPHFLPTHVNALFLCIKSLFFIIMHEGFKPSGT